MNPVTLSAQSWHQAKTSQLTNAITYLAQTQQLFQISPLVQLINDYADMIPKIEEAITFLREIKPILKEIYKEEFDESLLENYYFELPTFPTNYYVASPNKIIDSSGKMPLVIRRTALFNQRRVPGITFIVQTFVQMQFCQTYQTHMVTVFPIKVQLTDQVTRMDDVFKKTNYWYSIISLDHFYGSGYSFKVRMLHVKIHGRIQ